MLIDSFGACCTITANGGGMKICHLRATFLSGYTKR